MDINYSIILSNEYSDCIWQITGNDYESLIWDNSNIKQKPSKDQLNSKWEYSLSKYKKNNCKQEAKKRIAEFDWINDNETIPQLLNKEDFYAYRSALRELILNPVENPVFPPIPEEVWDAS